MVWRGRKYIIVVNIRKVDYLVDKLRFNFILFIYCEFIYLFIYLLCNLILSSDLLMSKILF